MSPALAPATTEAVLERLGFGAAPAPDASGLAAVYRAWCRRVPFDNLVKRIHLVSGSTAPFPNTEPEDFFASYLRHGTGGTCWPSSLALHALLRALGFAARLGSCAMNDDLNGPIHTHATVLVTVDGVDHWTDSSMLTDSVLPLRRGAGTRVDDVVRPLRAEPVGDFWRVWWLPQSRDAEMGCLMLDDDVTVEHCRARYEASRERSPFNTAVCATANRDGGCVSVAVGRRFDRDASGLHVTPLPEGWGATLIEEFGYSEEIVTRLPADDPSAAVPS